MELSLQQQQALLAARRHLLAKLASIRSRREEFTLAIGLLMFQSKIVSPEVNQASRKIKMQNTLVLATCLHA